ncbi:MAG: DUF4386 domain-containing protein [Chloroflexi bacterium]|nr:DUF4386 domain-containing protein [Chloroflexota bacterium]
MNNDRRTAIHVGVLYIIGTVAGVLSIVFLGNTLSGSNYLIKVSENQNQIVTASLLVLTMGFSLAMMSVVLFPILKKQNEALALGIVLFRGALEAVMYIVAVICWLLLLTVSREYVQAGNPDTSHFQTLGAVLLKASGQIGSILNIVFSLGALMIYYLFHQSRLIPSWMAVWGLVGAVLYLASGLSAMFSVDIGLLMAPLALQEMVMAVWLIVKGFNPPEVLTV